jgi:vitellogenic carboxypeptidase-like protein
MRYSRYRNLYNILEPKAVYTDNYLDFMNQPVIRKAVHVGRQVFAAPSLVYYHMTPDFMNSAMPWVEKLLDCCEHMRIMFYSGNMDFIVAYPLSVNSFEHMKWSGATEYRIANRTALMVGKELKG